MPGWVSRWPIVGWGRNAGLDRSVQYPRTATRFRRRWAPPGGLVLVDDVVDRPGEQFHTLGGDRLGVMLFLGHIHPNKHLDLRFAHSENRLSVDSNHQDRPTGAVAVNHLTDGGTGPGLLPGSGGVVTATGSPYRGPVG